MYPSSFREVLYFDFLEAFFFEEGCIAFWNVSAEEQQLVLDVVKPYLIAPREAMEEEEMPYPNYLLLKIHKY